MGRATGCSGYENHFDFQSLGLSFSCPRKSRPAIPPDLLAGRGALYVKHSGGVLVSEEPDG